MYTGRFLYVLFALSIVLAAVGHSSAASNEAVLYSFCTNSPYCPDGAFPFAPVIVNQKGLIYGTTYKGGSLYCGGYGCGEVFELGLTPKGTWAAKVIHSFFGGIGEGAFPEAGLVSDAAGNLYGTTSAGGQVGCGQYGCGTVFELTPSGSGAWTEQVLYAFCSASNCADGSVPLASLILDAAGNLYGTTASGGINTGNKNCTFSGCGTVFELRKRPNGTWAEKILYLFNFEDGAFPEANLTFDAAGNLYGTTSEGGTYGFGTVFELSPTSNGSWTKAVLYNFNFPDGKNPLAGVIFDPGGNLYGTTFSGGTGAACVYSFGCGTVFELSPGSNGEWTEQVLYSFCAIDTGICTDGSNPWGAVTFDGADRLLGTTNLGGTFGTLGTIFSLTRSNGSWSYSVVYDFGAQNNDGANPQAGLTFDARNGTFYGSTAGGGNSTNCNSGQACGTVFRFRLGTTGSIKAVP